MHSISMVHHLAYRNVDAGNRLCLQKYVGLLGDRRDFGVYPFHIASGKFSAESAPI